MNRGLREQCFWALGHVVVAFEDKKAFSVDTCGISAVKGIIFWCTRLRTHLAPGLGRVQEELAFDPNSACFSYDVRQVRFAPEPLRPCARPCGLSHTAMSNQH